MSGHSYWNGFTFQRLLTYSEERIMTIKQCWKENQRSRKAMIGFAILTAFGLSAHAQAQSGALSIDTGAVTYADHVATIINENCVVCHREGGIGPMQFTTYEQVRPWAPLIQYKVERREMPPYAYDHGIGIQELQGDWRLAQSEIDTITAWVQQGAPLGDWNEETARAPELPNLDEWTFAAQFGEPDLVMGSDPIDIPANGNDLWHRPFNYPGLTSDRCIKAVQVKPRGDAKTVVHHANSD